ncbi:hypothetical protein [Burkholderia multivorans]|uniref:hypothetical protein n=1 Tax=Burkholderia multivorans TaxID=87883 RepID=UPI0020B319D3|nr:hypothetical protein [Burkholderia multivorans]
MLPAKACVRDEQLNRTKKKVTRLIDLNGRAMAVQHPQAPFIHITGARFSSIRGTTVWREDAFRFIYRIDAEAPEHTLQAPRTTGDKLCDAM